MAAFLEIKQIQIRKMLEMTVIMNIFLQVSSLVDWYVRFTMVPFKIIVWSRCHLLSKTNFF